MMAKGVHIECNAKVTAVTEDSITYEQGGVEHVITDADTLVFANGYHVDPTIEEMLKEAIKRPVIDRFAQEGLGLLVSV